LTIHTDRSFFFLTYSDEDMEYIVVMHTLNKQIVSRELREKVHRVFGIRNVDELFERVPRQIPIKYFLWKVREIIPKDVLEEASDEVDKMLKAGIGIIPFYSPHYPDELRAYRTGSSSIYPPLVLYVKPPVSLSSFRYIAIVGTRRCSDWGRETAYRVGSMVTELGYIVVTGLAQCIDEYASKGALDRGGVVVGVRPWLEPLALPRETKMLVKKYGKEVVIIAEHFRKPAVSPKMLYYLRNRIIAGIAKLVIVVEARENGGSMHQIEWALRHGKPLAIFEHPDKDSPYYRAYLRYLEYSNKLSYRKPQLYQVKSVEELREVLSKLNI